MLQITLQQISPIMGTSVACAVGPSVITSTTDSSFKNLVFLEFISIFSGKIHLKINISHILNPNLTKKISLNPAHQDLSFQQHQRHIPIPLKFSALI